jgi:hypothetical protein
MKTNNLMKFIFCIISVALTSCIPQMENVDSQSNQSGIDIAQLNQHLSKTSSGQQTLSDMSSLVNQGYVLNIYLISQADIQSKNGHSGGGFEINDKTISIYVKDGLTTENQAHIVAHEMVHVTDDIKIDQFLQTRSYIESAVKDFLSRYTTTSITSFDQKVVGYTLGTLFCTESKAYTKNQQMHDQGFQTAEFAKGSSLPQYIDQNYIRRFGTNYGANANAMATWCLSQSSMTSIQNQLAW